MKYSNTNKIYLKKMRKNFYRNLACVLIFTSGLSFSTNGLAQVTIGSKGVPNTGALLDMKQEDKTDGSANSKGGLGLPRVALVAVDKLDPCVAGADATAKKSHIGLTVYNTTNNTSADATLAEGVYAWDGDMWTQYSGTTAGGADNGLSMDGKKVVLGGTLNRPTTIIGDATNNLTLNTPTNVAKTLDVTGATTLNGNLASNGTTALKNTNVTGNLGVSGTTILTGTTTIGSNIAAPAGAVLNIQTQADDDPANGGVTSNKGIMLPRVALTAVGSLDPIVTGTTTDLVKKSYKGLQVYNVSSAVEGAGIRAWDGEKWLKIVTTIPPAEVVTSNIHNLRNYYDCLKGYLTTPAQITRTMNFGTMQTDGTYAVEMQQDGSYSFALRLYGRTVGDLPAAAGNLNFYIYLLADGEIIDAAEYPVAIAAYKYEAGTTNPSVNGYSHYAGLSITLTAKKIKKGAKITIATSSGVFFYFEGTTMKNKSAFNWFWNSTDAKKDKVGNDDEITPVRSSLVYFKL